MDFTASLRHLVSLFIVVVNHMRNNLLKVTHKWIKKTYLRLCKTDMFILLLQRSNILGFVVGYIGNLIPRQYDMYEWS